MNVPAPCSAITGAKERLAGNPLLARSIQNRFAYLDPLNHLQVELIKRHRATAAAKRRRKNACSAASTCRSTGWRPACAIPAERGCCPASRGCPPMRAALFVWIGQETPRLKFSVCMPITDGSSDI
jgi:hypothetical protein